MTAKSRAMIGGLLVAALLFAVCRGAGLETDACWAAAVTGLCATWWVTEAVPIPVTSLVPFATFPLLGVLDHKHVAQAYGHYLILLLLGGFIISKAVEKSGVHRRMALAMVRASGGFGRRGLVLGFMLASATMSMWISNTATVLVLLPVALAVLEHDEADDLRVPLMLGIAYAGSIGGIGTIIGTPPNAFCVAVFQDHTGTALGFAEWMAWGVPIVAVLVPLAWLSLTRRVQPGPLAKLPEQGGWRPAEKRVAIMFALTAAAWVFRKNPFGGWQQFIGRTAPDGTSLGPGDETIALLAVVLMFVIPNGEKKGERMLDWKTATQIPWGLLILFGGGIAIASAFEQTGLSELIGEQLRDLASQPRIVVVLALCLAITFLTEITSNTATTVLLMPILAPAAIAANIDPRVLMVPAALSASCAFMLPVATAPNAIVFGTGHVPIRRMTSEGLRLNLIGVIVISLATVVLV